MLGKTLLTILVNAIAVVVLRQRHDRSSKAAGSDANRSHADKTDSAGNDVRVAAYLFLILMFGAAAIIYYLRWQDDHTVLTINLYNDGQSQPVTYQVHKYQLESRSFTTLDGVRITVADSERMEVEGLED